MLNKFNAISYPLWKWDIIMLSKVILIFVSNAVSTLAPPVTIYITFKTGERPVSWKSRSLITP